MRQQKRHEDYEDQKRQREKSTCFPPHHLKQQFCGCVRAYASYGYFMLLFLMMCLSLLTWFPDKKDISSYLHPKMKDLLPSNNGVWFLVDLMKQIYFGRFFLNVFYAYKLDGNRKLMPFDPGGIKVFGMIVMSYGDTFEILMFPYDPGGVVKDSLTRNQLGQMGEPLWTMMLQQLPRSQQFPFDPGGSPPILSVGTYQRMCGFRGGGCHDAMRSR